MADRSGSASDQHTLAANIAVGEQRAPGSQTGNTQAGALGKTHVIRQFGDQADVQCDAFGPRAQRAAALAVVQPHAPSDPPRIDARTDGFDDARAVTVRNHQRVGHGRAEIPGPLLGVAGIDGRIVQPHAHLTGAGQRVGQLPHLQYVVGGTLPFVERGAHGWEVRGRDGQKLTKAFRNRGQAEAFADLTGEFIVLDMPVLWLDGAERLASIPLFGSGSIDTWAAGVQTMTMNTTRRNGKSGGEQASGDADLHGTRRLPRRGPTASPSDASNFNHCPHHG